VKELLRPEGTGGKVAARVVPIPLRTRAAIKNIAQMPATKLVTALFLEILDLELEVLGWDIIEKIPGI
jgi:hypothetical protein